MAWPQYTVLGWLAVTIVSGSVAALRPSRGWLAIGPRHQRLAAAAFTAAAVSEAALLWQGDFFKGLF